MQEKNGDTFQGYMSPIHVHIGQRLDKTKDRAYDASIMDSANEIRSIAPALSSLLWNWWAVPTAR